MPVRHMDFNNTPKEIKRKTNYHTMFITGHSFCWLHSTNFPFPAPSPTQNKQLKHFNCSPRLHWKPSKINKFDHPNHIFLRGLNPTDCVHSLLRTFPRQKISTKLTHNLCQNNRTFRQTFERGRFLCWVCLPYLPETVLKN